MFCVEHYLNNAVLMTANTSEKNLMEIQLQHWTHLDEHQILDELKLQNDPNQGSHPADLSSSAFRIPPSKRILNENNLKFWNWIGTGVAFSALGGINERNGARIAFV